MRAAIFATASVCALLLASGGPASAGEGYEAAPARTAGQSIGKDQVKGDGYTVRERVTSEGFLNHYEVESSFGLFRAHSDRMLRMRLHEIATMKRLVRRGKGIAYLDSLG